MKLYNLRALAALAMAGATLAIPAGVVATIANAVPAHAAAVADTHAPHMRPCREEDGSGQAVCVWDARTMGNGVGHSFVAFAGGTDHARYVYVSHRVARQLIRGAR